MEQQVNKKYEGEQGSVLIISLVMLFLLTFFAISGSKTSTLNEKISGNTQKKRVTFQAAESAIESVVEEANGSLVAGNVLVDGMVAMVERPVSGVGYDLNDATILSEALICYDGEAVIPGFSMGVGKQNFVGHQFKIRGRGSITAINALTTNLQGVEKIGPSSGGGTGNCP
ncbi:MAG: hypothetical protein HQL71_05390 [Magnetococcales bacterium]|nr:hypothetical protein [Magnetococcales bacterium]